MYSAKRKRWGTVSHQRCVAECGWRLFFFFFYPITTSLSPAAEQLSSMSYPRVIEDPSQCGVTIWDLLWLTCSCEIRVGLSYLCMGCQNKWLYVYVTVHEKTRCKSKTAILDNAHLKVQTLCYFMQKSDLPNGDKVTSVWDNAILFPAFYSSLFILTSSAET